MQTKLDFLIERVQKQNSQANIKKIRAAYECAAKAHEGQKRRNGEPYIIHPVAVAEIVVEMGPLLQRRFLYQSVRYYSRIRPCSSSWNRYL